MDCDVLAAGTGYAVLCACGNMGLSLRRTGGRYYYGGGYVPGRAAGVKLGTV